MNTMSFSEALNSRNELEDITVPDYRKSSCYGVFAATESQPVFINLMVPNTEISGLETSAYVDR